MQWTQDGPKVGNLSIYCKKFVASNSHLVTGCQARSGLKKNKSTAYSCFYKYCLLNLNPQEENRNASFFFFFFFPGLHLYLKQTELFQKVYREICQTFICLAKAILKMLLFDTIAVSINMSRCHTPIVLLLNKRNLSNIIEKLVYWILLDRDWLFL